MGFVAKEDGAVGVEWVVLTAALAALGLAVALSVNDGMGNISNDVATEVAEIDPVDTFDFSGTVTLGGTDAPEPLVGAEFVEAHTWDTFGNPLRVYDRHMDRTDNGLRNQHRKWVNRSNDPDYSNPDRAAEQVLIIETAMAERGVAPHAGY